MVNQKNRHTKQTGAQEERERRRSAVRNLMRNTAGVCERER